VHRLTVLLAALALAGCPSSSTGPSPPPPPPPPPPPAPVASVAVSLSPASVVLGNTSQAAATPMDAQGNTLTGRGIPTWTVQGLNATVSASGLVTPLAIGILTVAARIEGIVGANILTVTPPPPPPAPVASMAVNLAASQIMVGQSSQATATAKDAAGNVLAGRSTAWASSLATVAPVNASGLVIGRTIGGADITATSEGISGKAAIVIMAPTSFGAGVKIVGADIGTGLYRSNNPATVSCYWERLSGFGGTLAEIIANYFSKGPAVVAIDASDKGFNSSGCAAWIQVSGPITTGLTAPFSDGVFIGGVDVAPGTWQSNGTGTGCYWERLRGFSGKFSEIIANFFGLAPGVATISATDQGFSSNSCGVWSKLP
jgi:hypothetical protein